jgi:hypothetical protein
LLTVTVAGTHSHLTGVGFDLSSVRPVFEAFVARHGMAERMRFHSGDFFKEELPTADVIIMGHILHDWDPAQKKMLVSKAFKALPSGGALIVYDAIIDDERRENAFGLLMSLNMLIETPGGFDYTGAYCRQWLRDTGFSQNTGGTARRSRFYGHRLEVGACGTRRSERECVCVSRQVAGQVDIADADVRPRPQGEQFHGWQIGAQRAQRRAGDPRSLGPAHGWIAPQRRIAPPWFGCTGGRAADHRAIIPSPAASYSSRTPSG